MPTQAAAIIFMCIVTLFAGAIVAFMTWAHRDLGLMSLTFTAGLILLIAHLPEITLRMSAASAIAVAGCHWMTMRKKRRLGTEAPAGSSPERASPTPGLVPPAAAHPDPRPAVPCAGCGAGVRPGGSCAYCGRHA